MTVDLRPYSAVANEGRAGVAELEEIRADIEALEKETEGLLRNIIG